MQIWVKITSQNDIVPLLDDSMSRKYLGGKLIREAGVKDGEVIRNVALTRDR